MTWSASPDALPSRLFVPFPDLRFGFQSILDEKMQRRPNDISLGRIVVSGAEAAEHSLPRLLSQTETDTFGWLCHYGT
jgi:hypothetical protein